jgi:molybdopterin synthase sulfur carrier subunit
MKAVYFAWVRERIGVAEEEITPPASVQTVEQLVDWLAARGEGYAAAFANRKSVRAALDTMHVTTQTPIASAREIANRARAG